MPATVRHVVDQARDFHSSFDPRTVPEKAAFRQLSRLQRRLAEKIVVISEDALASTVSLSKVDVDAAADLGVTGPGIALPEHLRILSAYTRRTVGGGVIPVDLVAYANNLGEALRVFPSAHVLGQRLYPVNTYEAGGFTIKGDTNITHGWEDLDGIDVLLVPTPPELTAPADLLTLPDSTHDALVVGLALWMAGRNGVLKNLPDLREEAARAEEAAVATLVTQDASSTWTVVRK